MASFLDYVFVTDDVIDFAEQEQAADILSEVAQAGEQCPQLFDYVVTRARIGAPLQDTDETLSPHELGYREGQRSLALELLALVKVARMNDREFEELLSQRRQK